MSESIYEKGTFWSVIIVSAALISFNATEVLGVNPLGDTKFIPLATLTLAVVGLIVVQERTSFEISLCNRGVPGRAFFAPFLGGIVGLATNIVPFKSIKNAWIENGSILVLILGFAIISRGLGRSRFFQFAAFRIAVRCQRDTLRLTLYLFLLASILTFFTSNDIVVLGLTPIIISICVLGRIGNARLLLLSQFVAANTLSMGLLIGSPTNLIVGLEHHISFPMYAVMMIVPAVIAFGVSFLLVEKIAKTSVSGKWLKNWSFESSYSIPQVATLEYTPSMRIWLWFFGLGVLLLAIVSYLDLQVWWAALPIVFIGLYWLEFEPLPLIEQIDMPGVIPTERQSIGADIRDLPYDILPFGIFFFAIAIEFAGNTFVVDRVVPMLAGTLELYPPFGSFWLTVSSGVSVNIVNDLPAAAIWSKLLQREGLTVAPWAYQSVLAGLNIGCYLTPVGALAGLIWVKESETARRRMSQEYEYARTLALPTAWDLFWFGAIHFIVICCVFAVAIPAMTFLTDLALSSPTLPIKSSMLEGSSPTLCYSVVGLAGIAILYILVQTKAVFRERGIHLSHLREIFVVLSHVRILFLRNRVIAVLFVTALLLGAAGLTLYWTEKFHAARYGALIDGRDITEEPLRGFISWLVAFIGSGFEDQYFPRSVAGKVIAGLVALSPIAVVIALFRVMTKPATDSLEAQLASGKLPQRRAVVFHYSSKFERFIELSLNAPDLFVVLVCVSDREVSRAKAFQKEISERLKGNRLYVVHQESPRTVFEQYAIAKADELFFISEHTDQSEIDTLAYLTLLDANLNDRFGGVKPEVLQTQFPKIIVESVSSFGRDRIRHSMSELLASRTIVVTFDEAAVKFLMADLVPSLASTNRHFRMGKILESPIGIIGTRLSDNNLRAYRLTSKGKKTVEALFKQRQDENKKQSVREHSLAVRRDIANVATQIEYKSKSGTHKVKPGELVGVIARVGEAHVILGMPEAAMSLHAAKSEAVVLLKDTTLASTPKSEWVSKAPENRKIIVVNMNPLAEMFVDELLRKKKNNIFVVCVGNTEVPSRFEQNNALEVIHLSNNDELVYQLVENPNGGPRIQSSDRVYVFVDYEQSTPPLAGSIDLIVKLDEHLKRSNRIRPKDFFVAVESESEETRFLFENLFVGKIIDSSSYRRSFLEALAMQFYRPTQARGRAIYKHTLADFKAASEVAKFLSPFMVVRANDYALSKGGASFTVVGQDVVDAAINIRAYSRPPTQLFAHCRIKFENIDSQGYDSSLAVRFDVSPDGDIRPDDILLLVACL